MWGDIPSIEELEFCLADPAKPIGMRMRSAYYLRQIHKEDESLQERVVQALAKGLRDSRHGSLLRHEFAYVMGQLRDQRGCPVLEETLVSNEDCVMVRHEAAEALGAIGAERSNDALTIVRNDPATKPELADTCQLALNLMEWRQQGQDPTTMPAVCACMLNPYSSVDPAPPNPQHQHMDTQELGNILCDPNEHIFQRYRAMFSLRNRGGAEAVQQLCRALTQDTSSPLLRHEVAYVLGQMQHPDSVEALEESLMRQDEHEMVRHESAEALGAIDGRWEDVERILERFVNDENVVVRESCQVALDAADYWGHGGPTKESDEEDNDAVTASFTHQKNERILVNHFNIKN